MVKNTSGDLTGQPAAEEQETIGSCLKRHLLNITMMSGVFSGIILGFILRATLDRPTTQRDLSYAKFVGEIFMNIFRAITLPMMISSLIDTIGSLDLSQSRKIGIRSVMYYTFTTICAVLIGVLAVITIHPGNVEHKSEMDEAQRGRNSTTADSLMDIVRNLFPQNLVQAVMATQRTVLIPPTFMENKTLPPLQNWKITSTYEQGTNIMGLLVSSIIFGLGIGKMGAGGKPLLDIVHCVQVATMSMTRALLWSAPIGICFMISVELWSSLDIMEILNNLAWFLVTVILGFFLHAFVLLPLLYIIIIRSLPFRFIVNMSQAMFTAFGTGSSMITLPVTLECLEKKNGINTTVTRFVIPLGATMNMDGTALYEAVAAIFIAQMAGVSLSIGDIVGISVAVTAAPQAGIITIALVLSTIGVSPDYIAYILPVDWILNRFRTTVNVLGDSYGAAIISHLSRKELLNQN